MRAYLGSKHDEAVKSFEFIVALRNDETKPLVIRLAAAKVVMDRVWGKEKQSVEVNRVTWTDPSPEIAELPQLAMKIDGEVFENGA